ncbi:MAG: rhomboid family intramembrane serine protease [Actinobacteria bacterium]|nr:MAG: rhomboid family intramembrane serine protease [Actinomycetota bacterium]TMK23106.1 MAG: rhomboid family intramembrane serine protease [Actinomycetota bacterium]TMK91726.1 MAG: rhomboid family intramembrane serine protease [Actinomycetota bacterium]
MLPIRDSTRRQRIPLVTVALIAANVIAFLFWQPTLRHVKDAELAQQTFFWCHGQIPYELAHLVPLARSGANGRTEIAKDYDVTTADAAQLQDYLGRACPRKNIWLSIVTAMFLHAGWLHLGGNMLFLWIFGDNVEDALGKLGYLAFYLVGGVAAGALQFVLAPNSTIPNVGASGAIAAVLGAYIVLYPRARILTAVFFFLITVIELPATVVLGLWFVLQLFQGVSGLAADVNSGVAYWAHVGGFGFGVVIALLFLRGRRRPAALPPSFPAYPERPDLP